MARAQIPGADYCDVKMLPLQTNVEHVKKRETTTNFLLKLLLTGHDRTPSNLKLHPVIITCIIYSEQ